MDFINKVFFARQEMTQKQLRLKLKITLFVSFAVVIFLSTLIAIVYFLGTNVLRDKSIESQEEMARTLASAVASVIDKQAEVLKLNASSQFIIDMLKKNNLKYLKKGEEEIQRYLMDMDKRWIEAPREHPFLKDYLENELSFKLDELSGDKEELMTVLVADKFGGLVGSTVRPSGFYSFDKDWWLSSYAKGRGKLFIGSIEYDEPSNLWCLPFAIPVEDEVGSVVGVFKASVILDTFFKPLSNFKIGKTGNAILADDKAYLVYHQKASPFANKFCEYEEFQKILQSSDKWGILDSVYLNQGKTLVAYAEVTNLLLLDKGIVWFVFVDRDLKEIFAPLDKLILLLVFIGAALIIILALVVFILSGHEQPNSILQVIKETPVTKPEEKNYRGNAAERAKKLPKEEK